MTLDEEMNGIEAPENQGENGQAPVAVAPEAAPVEAAPEGGGKTQGAFPLGTRPCRASGKRAL